MRVRNAGLTVILLIVISVLAVPARSAEPVKDQPTVGELTERSARLQAEMNATELQFRLLPRQYEDLKAAKDKTDAELVARQPKPETKSDAKVDIKPK